MAGNKPRNFDENQVFTDEEIRDTNTHNSSIVLGGDYDVFTIFIDNQLDQNVTIQIYGNRIPNVTKAVTIGTEWTVNTTDQGAKTINIINNGWLPYIFIKVTAADTPTSGELNAYVLQR